MHAITLSLVVEGPTDELVLLRLLELCGLGAAATYGKTGKAWVLKSLPAYNSAARHSPWLVLIDLDHDAACAPVYRQTLLPHPGQHMLLRIAVRAVEAWLLADPAGVSRFLGIKTTVIPGKPDELPDPKRTFVDLARKASRRAMREDMVPRPASGRMVGPAYTSRIAEFVNTQWQPEAAALRSPSLTSCIRALRRLSGNANA